MTTNITLEEIRALIHTEMKKLLQGNTSVTVNSQPSRNLLPPQLMARMTHPEAFDKAVTEGLIETGENGRITWTAERMLQVYFFGRLFCGDKAVYSKALDKYIWRQHKCIFPDSALKRLFGISLNKMRHKRRNLTVPQNFRYIDNLFAD